MSRPRLPLTLLLATLAVGSLHGCKSIYEEQTVWTFLSKHADPTGSVRARIDAAPESTHATGDGVLLTGKIDSEYEVFRWNVYQCDYYRVYGRARNDEDSRRTASFVVTDPYGYVAENEAEQVDVHEDAPHPDNIHGIAKLAKGLAWLPHSPKEAPDLTLQWTVLDLSERDLDAELHSGEGSTDRFGAFEVHLSGPTAALIKQLPSSIEFVRVKLQVAGDVTGAATEVKIAKSLFD